MAPDQRQGRKAAGLQRLALLGFGALLLVLFLGFAIAQGLGHPSVPSGAVAIVEDAPDDIGTVSRAQLDRGIVQAAAGGQVKPVPKPGDEKYDELKEKALGEILDAIWIQGEGAEMGFEVTPKEVAAELKKLKAQAFKTDKQYKEFLEESKFTQADVNQRVKLQILSTKIQEKVTGDAPQPSKGEIEDFYEAAKSTQFTTPESRDIRFVVNKDKAKVEKAKAALEKDDSTKSWEKVAKQYSSDPGTKNKGGLQSGIAAGGVAEPLDGAVAAAPQGQLEGPIQDSRGSLIFEVVKITPETVQSLEEAESQISAQLAEQGQQQRFARFLRGYTSKWRSRTFCAAEFATERCANFKSDGRSPEANPACYEANPKTPAEACPAPVGQVKPALPGSVTVLTPEGQKLAQRPRPAGLEAAAGAPTELPPGVVPEVPGE